MSDATNSDPAEWPRYALPRGTTINGYRIERVLGSGGFGVTYLARDLLDQPFAIKEYFPRQFATRDGLTVVASSSEDEPLFDECRDRFLREAQALAVLGRAAGADEGIVRVRTYFEAHGTCFLVMDFIDGLSLAHVLRQTPGGLAAPRVRSLLVQLLNSIGAVHRAGLMHRDIKPANIILRDNDKAVLIDFGSSREAAVTGHTTAYTQIFSGGYAPPEQMLGQRQGEFSDIYAIGAVCYQAIGGKVVDALVRRNALDAGLPDPQPSAEQVAAGRYPAPLVRMIGQALAINPARRPPNVEAMLAGLGPEDPPPDATVVVPRRTVSAAEAPPRREPRRARVILAACAVAVVLAGAASVAVWMTRAPPAASRVDVAAVRPPPVSSIPIAPAPTAPMPMERPPAVEATGRPSEAPAPAPVEPPPKASVKAIAMPPVVSSPIDGARAAAAKVPCSVLGISDAPDGSRVSGVALQGGDLDQLLMELRGAGRLTDETERIDRFACEPISVIADSARRAWNSVPRAMTLRLNKKDVISGTPLGITAETPLPAVYVDLYQADGAVRHLFRPGTAGARGKIHVDWMAVSPPGPGLIVAIGAAKPLDLGTRPLLESAAGYLAELRTRLAGAEPDVMADVATVTIRAAERVVPKAAAAPPPVRPSNSLRSERCANMVSRAQLGETLSNDELVALRTECRS